MPVWDKGMRGISNTVNPAIPIVVLGIYSHGFFTNDETLIRDGFKSAITIGFAALISTSLKGSVNRLRPSKKYPDDIVLRVPSGRFSFPSGHTTSAFAMATSLTLSYKKWYVALPSYLYAGLVGYSRMRLGVHFPSDVLGGMIIGIGSGFLVWQLDYLLNKK
jgi:undecaprenyl-diphosphatase